MTPTCSAGTRLGALLAAALLAVGCQDAMTPNHQPGTPALVQTGPQPAIAGLGTLGTGDSTPGSDLQQFDFDVKADLTGRLFYRDWQPPFNGASITVDQDTATKITVFQDGWSACADGTHGAQFAGTGRLDTGGYEFFIVRACDDGPSGSGADRFELTDGDTTASGYDRDSLLSSGDIVKTVTSPGGATGNLTITTATTGADAPAGYTFSVSGPAGSTTDTIGANASRTFAGIATGDYTVQLSTVPANCSVSGGTSRTATVPSGGTTTVAYSMSCAATTPQATRLAFTVQPSNTTAGSAISPPVRVAALDSAGNTVTAFTGSVTVAIGNNPGGGTLSGTRTLAAANGVATFSNLSIDRAGNGYTLTATASGLAGATSAPFNITAPVTTGDLTITTATTGQDTPAGYTVTATGPSYPSGKAVSIGASATLTGPVESGGYAVQLSAVPANCSVSGATSRSVSVPSGGTAATAFSVSCVTPNQPPSVNAGSDENVLVGLLYSLSWSFSDSNNDGPWSYTINWGDGSSTSGSTSSQGSRSTGHTYLLIGQYTIRVTVTDSHGASGSDTKVLTVLAPLPGLP